MVEGQLLHEADEPEERLSVIWSWRQLLMLPDQTVIAVLRVTVIWSWPEKFRPIVNDSWNQLHGVPPRDKVQVQPLDRDRANTPFRSAQLVQVPLVMPAIVT
jgi:hypothetical protein